MKSTAYNGPVTRISRRTALRRGIAATAAAFVATTLTSKWKARLHVESTAIRNHITERQRLWHYTRSSLGESEKQFITDIGYPHYLFERVPHLFTIRRQTQGPRRVDIEATLKDLNYAPPMSGGITILLAATFDSKSVEGHFWCDELAADSIADRDGNRSDIEIMALEDDLGEYFRNDLLDPEFRAVADQGYENLKQIRDLGISPETFRIIAHEVQFESVSARKKFEAFLGTTDLDIECSTEDGNPLLVWIHERGPVGPLDRHYRMADLFLLAENNEGRYRGWKLDDDKGVVGPR